MAKVDRVGPMLTGSDTSPLSLKHEWGHLRYHHRSSMGDTKISDGSSENCLDRVILLCLKSGFNVVRYLASEDIRQRNE